MHILNIQINKIYWSVYKRSILYSRLYSSALSLTHPCLSLLPHTFSLSFSLSSPFMSSSLPDTYHLTTWFKIWRLNMFTFNEHYFLRKENKILLVRQNVCSSQQNETNMNFKPMSINVLRIIPHCIAYARCQTWVTLHSHSTYETKKAEIILERLCKQWRH